MSLCTWCGEPAHPRLRTCTTDCRVDLLVDAETRPGPQPNDRHAALIEDLKWLLECGETHPEAIARRLGWRSPRSLARSLRRIGRADLAVWVDKRDRGAA